MTTLLLDENHYTQVAAGLIKRVVESLLRQFVNAGIIDLSKDLTPQALDLVYQTGFDVLLQFEDLKGHANGTTRHPAIVGFAEFAAHSLVRPKETETILISWQRTDLHGGLEVSTIHEVYAQMQATG